VSAPQQASTGPAPPSDIDAEPDFAAIRSQALFRQMNEEIHRIADRFGVDETLEIVCECEHESCFARLSVPVDDYEAVRRFPTRFVTKPEHVSSDERVVQETARYVVIEKVGPSAETAILLDPRKRTIERPAAWAHDAPGTGRVLLRDERTAEIEVSVPRLGFE
jgi:hypothetical protein